MATRYDPRLHAYDDQSRFSGMIYLLMLVVALAFGGFVWQLYSPTEIPRIAAPPGPYKSAPASESAVDAAEAGAPGIAAETVAPPAPEAPALLQLTPTPDISVSGPYVAQIAALQSEAAAEVAWRRLAARAPHLFASAQLDVERADLGQRGIYYRVRAGYFADRAGASRFCARIRQMGQDCFPTAR